MSVNLPDTTPEILFISSQHDAPLLLTLNETQTAAQTFRISSCSINGYITSIAKGNP